MTNEELVDNVVSMFVVEESTKTLLKAVATAMAIRKDRQFKKYLEKKKDEYMSQRDNENMWSEQWAVFHALTCTMNKIIEEFFTEK